MYLNRPDIRAPGALRASGLYTSLVEHVAFGVNSDVDAAEDVIVAGGTYAGFPTALALAAAETLNVVSDSAADDAAGTGARAVTLVGLGSDGKLLTEVVVMDGTTVVGTTNAFYRVLRAYVSSAGSGGTNAGVITAVGDPTSANVFATMVAGTGRTQAATLTVPAGEYGSIHKVSGQVVNNRSGGTAVEAVMAVLRRANGSGSWQRLIEFPVSNLGEPSTIEFAAGIGLAALDDVKLTVVSTSAGNMDVYGRIEAVTF